MAITRWDPLKNMLALQERMNRLFEDSLSRSRGLEEDLALGTWLPPVDIYEEPERIVLRADLPGVRPENVDIRIESNTLTLSGERRLEREVKRDNYHRVERQYGSFSRSFTLPGTVDTERIRAEHRDGVLEISLPKREESRPKQIKVQVT
jgi:HSP20 family protein